MNKTVILFLMCSLAHLCCLSQNLNTISRDKGISVKGTARTSWSVLKRDSTIRLNHRTAIGLNLDFFGYVIPFSFVYANRGGQISNPFSGFRLNPTYKNYRVEIGRFTPNLGNYSVAGKAMIGMAAHANWDRWSVSLMRGKTSLSPIANANNITTEKKCTAANWIFKTKNHQEKLVFVYADRLTSTDLINSSTDSLWGKHLVLEISEELKLGQKWRFSTQIGYSYRSKSSKKGFWAQDYSLSYNSIAGSWKLWHERIQDDYQSILIPMMLNNFKLSGLEYSGNSSSGKWSWMASVGIQTDYQTTDLESNEQLNYQLNLDYRPNSFFQIGISTSTFNSSQLAFNDRIYGDEIELDTISYIQIDRQSDLFFTGVMEKASYTLNWTVNASHSSQSLTEETTQKSDQFTAGSNITFTPKSDKLSLSSSTSWQKNNSSGRSLFWRVAATYQLSERVRLSNGLQLSSNIQPENSVKYAGIRAALNWRISERSSSNFNLISRKQLGQKIPASLQANLQLQYRFG